MTIDIRFDPFKNVWEPYSIVNEVVTIPANSPYRIRLIEVPQKTSPTSLAVSVANTLAAAVTATQTTLTVSIGAWFEANNVILVDSEYMQITAVSGNVLTVTRGYNSSTPVTHAVGADVVIQDSMQEVAADPAKGQFYPDYNTEKGINENWNTGTIEFNALDAGKRLLMSYLGIGTLADKRVIGAGYQLFTANGVFKVPRDITKVIITGCGGGAGGGGSNGSPSYTYYGGGAGGQVVEYCLTVVPDMTYAITIGGGGGGNRNATNGNAGGATSFGNLLTLGGGAGNNSGAGPAFGGYWNFGTQDGVHGLFGRGGGKGTGTGGKATGYGAGGGAAGARDYYGGAGAPGFLFIKRFPEGEF